jgi:hypothetical protein
MINRIYYDNTCGGSSNNGCGSSSTTPSNNTANTPTPLELHACMGLNACKNHDRFGTNSCAGKGYCATVQHVCHTLNECRGQGGCGLYGSAEEQDIPAMNDCAWKGSCATPIQAERISTQGMNTGKSVWKLARQLFEERLTKEGREFGTPRFPDGPPSWWLKTLGPFDACGSSGDMNCTFGLKENKCGGLCGNKAETGAAGTEDSNSCKTANA